MNKLKPNTPAIIALLLAGIAVALYLLYSKYFAGSIVCNFSSCSTVTSSKYAYIMGLPISLSGLFYYIGFILVFFLQNDLKKVFYYSLLGVAFTSYFSFIEAFILKAWCEWCIYTAIICFALSLLSFWNMFKGSSIKDQIKSID
jgi:uncharacterized membrane protein